MHMRTIFTVLVLACAIVLVAYLVLRSGSEHEASRSANASIESTSEMLAASDQTVDAATQVGLRRDVHNQNSGLVGSREVVNAAPDLFELMRSLATKAYEGDAEAQLTIARAMALCWSALPFANEAVIALALPSYPIPISARETYARDVARCEKTRGGDPFAALPPIAGGYTYEYWLGRAADAGHPLAGAIHSMNRIVKVTNEKRSDEREAELQGIRARLVQAVRANTPEHHVFVGQALMVADSNDEAHTNLRGVAWILMACRAGACTNVPALVPMISACPPGLGNNCDELSATYYQAEQQLGPERYARAQQLSYEIEDLINKKKWDDIDLTVRARE
jgi:hypothetical protein